MFTSTVFEVLLLESRSVLSPAQQTAGSKRVKTLLTIVHKLSKKGEYFLRLCSFLNKLYPVQSGNIFITMCMLPIHFRMTS